MGRNIEIYQTKITDLYAPNLDPDPIFVCALFFWDNILINVNIRGMIQQKAASLPHITEYQCTFLIRYTVWPNRAVLPKPLYHSLEHTGTT